jgi:UDP-glucose 4-epimerase
MKKAIVAGANGYIGNSFVKELIKNNIDVLAITRCEDVIFLKNFEKSGYLTHIKIDLKDIFLLPQKIHEKNWIVGEDCVFYNFSWKGDKKIMDGSIENQFSNITYLANSVKVASELGCSKFINSGSIEETFAENYLELSWGKKSFLSGNESYSISKMASRDMCKLVAYLYKIDYVHTRFSAVVDRNLSGSGYISNTFKNILNGAINIQKPLNENLFDIIELSDLTKAYYLLGLYGKNKLDYFIGTGSPHKLTDYFDCISNWKISKNIIFPKKYKSSSFFNAELLLRDTGLNLSNSFINLLTNINLS